jgi:hypothetical protein
MALDRYEIFPAAGRQTIFLGATEPRAARPGYTRCEARLISQQYQRLVKKLSLTRGYARGWPMSAPVLGTVFFAIGERLGSRYRSGRFRDWLKFMNPAAPAVKREFEEDWG